MSAPPHMAPPGAREWLAAEMRKIATSLATIEDPPRDARGRMAYAIGWLSGCVSKEAGDEFERAFRSLP